MATNCTRIGMPLIFNPKTPAADLFRRLQRDGLSLIYSVRGGYRVIRRNNSPTQAA